MEKHSNGELTEVVKKQRRAAAKQDAEAAGREHKHQDEVQQLRKVGSCTQHFGELGSHMHYMHWTQNSKKVLT